MQHVILFVGTDGHIVGIISVMREKSKMHGKPCIGIWVEFCELGIVLVPSFAHGQQDSLFCSCTNERNEPSCQLCSLHTVEQLPDLIRILGQIWPWNVYPWQISECSDMAAFYWMRKGEYWVLSRNLADSVSSPGLSNTPPDCLTPLQQGLVTACVGVKHLLSSSREETIDEKSSTFYILSVALNNCCKRRDSNKETNLGIRFLIRHWFKWLFFGWM